MNDDIRIAQALSDQVVAACHDHRRALHTLALRFAELVDGGHLRRLGYAKPTEYAAKVLGLDARAAVELLRIGRKLPHLPILSAALQAGELEWTKARELLRVLNAENEAAWVAHAREHTSREVERDVSSTAFGGLPPEGPPAPGLARRRVVFLMESADEEVLRRALALHRAKTGLRPCELEDGVLLAAMAAWSIRLMEDEDGGPAENTHVGAGETAAENTHVGVETAAENTHVGVETAAENTHVGVETAAENTRMAASASPNWAGAEANRSIPTGERFRIIIEHCSSCGATHMQGREVSESVVEEANCDAEHVEMRPGKKQGHLTRAIPPSLRRIVLHRAGWKCEVPGCNSSLWLDIHHFRAWAQGGGHTLENLGAICSPHHRATHEGVLALERLPNGAVRVTHADGTTRTGPEPRTHVGAGPPPRGPTDVPQAA